MFELLLDRVNRLLTTLLSNPMLGETFEFQDDKRKFVAEKTSHHPPIMACHAEGEGWEYWATNEAKNKLNGEHRTVERRTEAVFFTKIPGKSFEVVPIGWTHLKIGADHYRWSVLHPLIS